MVRGPTGNPGHVVRCRVKTGHRPGLEHATLIPDTLEVPIALEQRKKQRTATRGNVQVCPTSRICQMSARRMCKYIYDE